MSEVSQKPPSCFLTSSSRPQRCLGTCAARSQAQLASGSALLCARNSPFCSARARGRVEATVAHSPSGQEKAILVLRAPGMVNLPQSHRLCQLGRKQPLQHLNLINLGEVAAEVTAGRAGGAGGIYRAPAGGREMGVAEPIPLPTSDLCPSGLAHCSHRTQGPLTSAPSLREINHTQRGGR